jgi:hypothetical protein
MGLSLPTHQTMNSVWPEAVLTHHIVLSARVNACILYQGFWTGTSCTAQAALISVPLTSTAALARVWPHVQYGTLDAYDSVFKSSFHVPPRSALANRDYGCPQSLLYLPNLQHLTTRLWNAKSFQDSPLHRIRRHMYIALNVDKKITNYTVCL